ncbi:MAG: Small Arf-related GTPase [Promethearchaeota archaeon]|nr:MAG: Small Arf-related GTPase [Candidatus Lokiarchaeota archaeon]
MLPIEDTIKVIVSGLDNAGKTSILTAIDKKYNFREEILELKPTIKVRYQRTQFLGSPVIFWDMGGQEQYRDTYIKRKDIYFTDTDLLLYVIDIQDRERFETSLDYLDSLLTYFKQIDPDLPVIVTFHKYDPEVRSYEEINEDVMDLKELINEEHPEFKILFQQTSIFDVISIVQLISYGLSVFDNKFFELSLLMEKYQMYFNCSSLILFDSNGIIISEFYNNRINPELYTRLIESLKEHLFLVERMEEEDFQEDLNFFTTDDKTISYLHRIDFEVEKFFISVVLKKKYKEYFLDKFVEFRSELERILGELM